MGWPTEDGRRWPTALRTHSPPVSALGWLRKLTCWALFPPRRKRAVECCPHWRANLSVVVLSQRHRARLGLTAMPSWRQPTAASVFAAVEAWRELTLLATREVSARKGNDKNGDKGRDYPGPGDGCQSRPGTSKWG